MRFMFILLLLALSFLAACKQVEPVGCTKELKICPDGTGVGRTGPNCEFEACHVSNVTACPEDAKICPDGSSVGRSGPSCEFAACPVSNLSSKNMQKRYVGDAETCKLIRFICAEGEMFSDDLGCGCIEELPVGGEFCQPWEREKEGEPKACTLQYDPVCGWFAENVQCIKYPCAITGGNRCGACAGPDVKYVTPGECPTGISPQNDSRRTCADYYRNGAKEEHCATCGNGICEPFEECTSSNIFCNQEGQQGCTATSDCGGLVCEKDCASN